MVLLSGKSLIRYQPPDIVALDKSYFSKGICKYLYTLRLLVHLVAILWRDESAPWFLSLADLTRESTSLPFCTMLLVRSNTFHLQFVC